MTPLVALYFNHLVLSTMSHMSQWRDNGNTAVMMSLMTTQERTIHNLTDRSLTSFGPTSYIQQN